MKERKRSEAQAQEAQAKTLGSAETIKAGETHTGWTPVKKYSPSESRWLPVFVYQQGSS